MLIEGIKAHLYLDGQNVGTIAVKRNEYGWGFGDFFPNGKFSAFAPVYGRWSLLMHADAEEELLSAATSEELRETEQAMGLVKASLFVPSTGLWHSLGQINIDGTMIEWK
jgi:hypothetical protein